MNGEDEAARAIEAAAKKAAAKSGPAMRVKVYSPFKVYFDEQASSVSAVNATGPFDILPKHHNFITLLAAGEITVRTPTDTKKIRISGGLMHVKADKTTIFLDI